VLLLVNIRESTGYRCIAAAGIFLTEERKKLTYKLCFFSVC
jgi:hypothetical protein